MRTLSSLLLLAALTPAACLAQSTTSATSTASSSSSSSDSTASSLDSLNLKLPESSPFAADPPGTWYGDHDASGDQKGKNDDGKWQVHGSVTTGVAYSSHARGRDTGTYTGLDLNLSKRYTTDEGNSGLISLNISTGQGNGPMFGRGYGPPPPGPRPPPHPDSDDDGE
ncbi:MAG: hypothetical protein QM601_02195 [Pseudoxanthomonas sp.]